MPKVTHFQINADDPKRAIKFYSDVFGWDMQKWEGPVEYWMITTGSPDEPGIGGGLAKRTDPSFSIVNTISVPSVDDFSAKIISNGGEVVTPKSAIPGIGYYAYCKDSEGNAFGIMEDDSSAGK